MKQIINGLGLFLGLILAIFLGVLLAQTAIKPKVITVVQPAEQLAVQNSDVNLGSFNRQKISATSSQITVTNSTSTLKDLMKTADSTLTNATFDGINAVVLQPLTGAIRYLIGNSTIADQTEFEAGTNGGKIYTSNQQLILATPDEIYLIRDSGESSNVTVQIPVFGVNY